MARLVRRKRKSTRSNNNSRKRHHTSTQILGWMKENSRKVLDTKDLTMLIQDLTGITLGSDLTAGGKNLRKYLRSLPEYNDNKFTSYHWTDSKEDLRILSGIVEYYSRKSNRKNLINRI